MDCAPRWSGKTGWVWQLVENEKNFGYFPAPVDENPERRPKAVAPFDWWFVPSATRFPDCAWREAFAFGGKAPDCRGADSDDEEVDYGGFHPSTPNPQPSNLNPKT